MAAAVTVVLIALLVGGGALLYVLQANLEITARAAATTRAAEVAAMVRTQGVSEATTTIRAESRSGQLVQILTADGAVRGASSHLVATRPMSPQRPAPKTTTITEEDLDHVGPGGDWIVASTGLSAHGRAYIVQVAVPIEVQHQTVQTVAVFLLAASPALLVAVAVAVWLLVGRALRTVEHIRSEVATIDDQRLGRRIDVPATHDEIAALAVTMNTMLDRLQTSQQAQRAFVSDASHELRSPLATLTTATELAMTADEAGRTRLLGTIGGELGRMRALVDNLMTLARADAHDLVIVREDVDLDDLVDAEIRRLRATSTHRVLARLEPVRLTGGDPLRIAQALRNVVDNAERHARTTIRLTLRAGTDAAVLWVDNDGDPVPIADRERIFERFVRLDESRSRDAGGSGLGLAIARTTIDSHHGTLLAAESDDGWCRFEMRLPLPGPAGVAGPVDQRERVDLTSQLEHQADHGDGDEPATDDIGHPVIAEIHPAESDGGTDKAGADHGDASDPPIKTYREQDGGEDPGHRAVGGMPRGERIVPGRAVDQ
ncbi:ATP-binding protein [Microlunatus ginsengisoli]|uniref:histidine kinase n=1 Tax=Microlunatus ginsengisoli TaxID=363863 RepID=A0ABP7AXP3_9ACTN